MAGIVSYEIAQPESIEGVRTSLNEYLGAIALLPEDGEVPPFTIVAHMTDVEPAFGGDQDAPLHLSIVGLRMRGRDCTNFTALDDLGNSVTADLTGGPKDKAKLSRVITDVIPVA